MNRLGTLLFVATLIALLPLLAAGYLAGLACGLLRAGWKNGRKDSQGAES